MIMCINTAADELDDRDAKTNSLLHKASEFRFQCESGLMKKFLIMKYFEIYCGFFFKLPV